MKRNVLILLLLLSLVGLGRGNAFGQFNWTKDAMNPVLSGGGTGTWSNHIFNPWVLYNIDSVRYEMWFNATPGPLPGRPWPVGFATSADGVHWSMYPSPVVSPNPGTWDERAVCSPVVLREGGAYKMWYAGWPDETSPNYIGYATSPDGIHWQKSVSNPIMGPGTSAWEAGGPISGTVMHDLGVYRMWYTGYDASFQITKIGYATSVDGVVWHSDTVNNPILGPGTAGLWDGGRVLLPKVLRIDTTYFMWYTGEVTSGTLQQTGLALSTQANSGWVKHMSNPILAVSPGSWDANAAGAGAVLRRGNTDTLDLWYDGFREPGDTYLYRIGHATAPIMVTSALVDIHEIPVQFALEQDYPNPFNPSTTIRYALPHASFVTLTVYNTLGQQVAQLVNEHQQAGYHDVVFRGDGLASGVYFYKLQAGQFLAVQKMILMK